MKIYVASHCRWAACHVAEELEKVGHEVISTWHGEPFYATDAYNVGVRQSIADKDIHQVERCNALVLIAGADKYSGGKFVETGIALGLGKPVVVLGRRENMLMWSSRVQAFEEIPTLIEALEKA